MTTINEHIAKLPPERQKKIKERTEELMAEEKAMKEMEDWKLSDYAARGTEEQSAAAIKAIGMKAMGTEIGLGMALGLGGLGFFIWMGMILS